MQSAEQAADPMIPTIPTVPAVRRTRRQRTSERMSQTAALLKTKRRELGNVMKKDGGSNLRMEPIRRERRVKTTAVKNRSGSGQEEDGGHLTPKVI